MISVGNGIILSGTVADKAFFTDKGLTGVYPPQFIEQIPLPLTSPFLPLPSSPPSTLPFAPPFSPSPLPFPSPSSFPFPIPKSS